MAIFEFPHTLVTPETFDSWNIPTENPKNTRRTRRPVAFHVSQGVPAPPCRRRESVTPRPSLTQDFPTSAPQSQPLGTSLLTTLGDDDSGLATGPPSEGFSVMLSGVSVLVR